MHVNSEWWPNHDFWLAVCLSRKHSFRFSLVPSLCAVRIPVTPVCQETLLHLEPLESTQWPWPELQTSYCFKSYTVRRLVNILSRLHWLHLSEHISYLHIAQDIPPACGEKDVMRALHVLSSIISTRYFTVHVWYVRLCICWRCASDCAWHTVPKVHTSYCAYPRTAHYWLEVPMNDTQQDWPNLVFDNPALDQTHTWESMRAHIKLQADCSNFSR